MPPELKNDRYQVFLLNSRCSMPISFAKHYWFVVNQKGMVSRWEVLIQKRLGGVSWGYLHKDAKKPFEPLGTFSFYSKSFWTTALIGSAEGGEGSFVEKMAEFINKSDVNYPLNDHYFLLGPNSNTYVRWIIDHFPEFPVRLPCSAIGRGYEV